MRAAPGRMTNSNCAGKTCSSAVCETFNVTCSVTDWPLVCVSTTVPEYVFGASAASTVRSIETIREAGVDSVVVGGVFSKSQFPVLLADAVKEIGAPLLVIWND